MKQKRKAYLIIKSQFFHLNYKKKKKWQMTFYTAEAPCQLSNSIKRVQYQFNFRIICEE